MTPRRAALLLLLLAAGSCTTRHPALTTAAGLRLEPVSFAELSRALTEFAARPKPPIIRIRADMGLQYQQVVRVMDGIPGFPAELKTLLKHMLISHQASTNLARPSCP